MKSSGQDIFLPLFVLQLPQKTLARYGLCQQDWVDLLALLLDVDVDESNLTDTLICLDDYCQVVRLAKNLFGRDRFLSSYVADIRARHMGAVGLAMEAAPSIDDSLTLWVDNAQLLAPMVDIVWRETTTTRGFEIRLTAELGDITETFMELILLMTAAIIRNLSGGVARAEIGFAHAPELPPAFYQDSFGLTPAFGQPANTMSFPRSQTATANDYYAPLLYKQALQGIRDLRAALQSHLKLSFRVRQYLFRGAEDSQFPSLEETAEHFNMSPRTFTRHLQEEGASFRDLRTELQNDIARRLLRQSTLPIKAIVERAGFSNMSAFSRAFHNANGQTPLSFRRGSEETDA